MKIADITVVINLSLSPGSILNSPEITWAAFVQLDLYHLLLLCRLLALAALTPVIYIWKSEICGRELRRLELIQP